MLKIDLHTHSVDSPDGGLDKKDYHKLVDSSLLDIVAITDHGSISYAMKLSKEPQLKHHVIVGQEVLTDEGEIIGLFLNELIPDGLSPHETVTKIYEQSGFVVIPHPADRTRNGMSFESMDTIANKIDAVEVLNGRAISKSPPEIRHWARQNGVGMLASSDAHNFSGVGRTYTLIGSHPTSSSDLRDILQSNAKQIYDRPPLSAYLAPKLNRLRKKLSKS